MIRLVRDIDCLKERAKATVRRPLRILLLFSDNSQKLWSSRREAKWHHSIERVRWAALQSTRNWTCRMVFGPFPTEKTGISVTPMIMWTFPRIFYKYTIMNIGNGRWIFIKYGRNSVDGWVKEKDGENEDVWQVREDVRVNQDRYSLLYVPHPFIIPGGRFREFYYWWEIERKANEVNELLLGIHSGS